MANKKITDLPSATAVNSGDKIEIVQGGTSKQADVNLLSSGSGLSGLTTNKVLKAGSATTAVDSNITDDGTNVGIVTGNSQIYALPTEAGFYYFENNTGIVKVNDSGTYLQHDDLIDLNAPSVTKNGVEVATINDIPTVDTTIIDGSTNAVSGNAVFDGLATKSVSGSVLLNHQSLFNPADATTYHFGSLIPTVPTTTAAARRTYIGQTVTVISASFTLLVSGTLGTSEDTTVYIRVNNTTDYTIGTIKMNSATQQVVINTSLNISLASTDYFEIKVVTPTFVTNPINVCFAACVNYK